MLKQGHGPVLSACSSASTTKSSGLCPEHEAYVRESPSYEGLGFREGPTYNAILKNQVEKNMEAQMETGFTQWFLGFGACRQSKLKL